MAKQKKWFNISGLILSVVLLVFLIYGNNVAHSENQTYLTDYQKLQYAIKQLSNNKQKPSPQAEQLLVRIHIKYPNDYQINRYMAVLYAQKANYEKAAQFFQLALNERPFLLKDTLFTLQYGETLYSLKLYGNSKKMLEVCLKTSGAKQYKKKINMMLANIQQVGK